MDDVSLPAENDLRDIVRYVSAQLLSPITALKRLAVFEEALSSLSEMLQKHPLVIDDRLSSMGYRKLIVKTTLCSLRSTKKRK
ncbi:MAG: type II toxin-antitoxin system RelE/ParE family toxin [Proteobacteria bacterium]|nr:type II toxin-antitoxin system RelE/ParE family toxin [Pseudomonadota bacterium]